MTTSVAVVGGGLAGLCAAIEAARDGKASAIVHDIMMAVTPNCCNGIRCKSDLN